MPSRFFQYGGLVHVRDHMPVFLRNEKFGNGSAYHFSACFSGTIVSAIGNDSRNR